jgi:hypothetical protein
MLPVKNIFLLALVLNIITACSPTGYDPTHVEMSDLVGLWDSSEKNGSKIDVIYTRVTSAGAVIEYDFDGDAVDQGLKCYHVDTGALKNIAANRFLVTTDMHAGKQFEVEIELLDAGNALKVYYLDAEDPTKTTESQIWTRVADESLLDTEPSCRNK